MNVQNRADINSSGFLLGGQALSKEAETILQDAARVSSGAGDLLFGTVMALLTTGASAGKWVPMAALDGEDGSSMPKGIYVGADIDDTDLVTGDVVGAPILINGIVDRGQVVLEGGLTMASEVAATPTSPVRATIEGWLKDAGIVLESTEAVDELENA